jgi:hypothetical protein
MAAPTGPSSARAARRIASPITRDATRKNAPPEKAPAYTVFLQNISTKFPDTCLSYLADISVFDFCRRDAGDVLLRPFRVLDQFL